METVEVVDAQIVRGLGRLTDAGTDNRILGLDIQFRQRHFDDIENGKIATARAPGHIRPSRHIVEFLINHKKLESGIMN